MRKLFFTVNLLAAFTAFGFFFVQKTIDELLQQLDLSKEGAEQYVWSNCSNNAFYFPYPGELKNAPANEKTAIVKIVGEFSKAYVNSSAFQQQYAQYREDMKPQPPEAPKKAADMKKEQKEQMQKSLDEMVKARDKAPADQKAMYDSTIEMFKTQLKEMDDPDNQMYSSDMDSYMQQGYEQQMEQYNQQVAEWEQEHPVDSKGIVKAWLQKFLSVSATVDFNAKTRTNQYGKKVFELSEYEEQSDLWKLCYRAGKETTQAGRAYAQEWLKELK
jgi:hypothetical protein